MRILMFSLLATGCAAPRVITSMSFAGDHVKFIYNGASHGLIQCDVQSDGTLSNCERLPVTFKKKGA